MSPGTWPGGAWVPGGPRPCFLLLLLVHDPNFVFRNFHQDVSRFTVHKGLRPNSRIMYRFFTSHQPMMNEQDQVTWTNWPASKKKTLTTEDIHQLQQDTPAHNELRAPMNQFMERQFANQEPLRNNLLIPTLEARINQAAKLRGALAQMVHAISRNFTIRDTNQIMEQLIIRCRGDLNVYILNETLMHNHCMEIVGSLGLTMLDTMLSVDD